MASIFHSKQRRVEVLFVVLGIIVGSLLTGCEATHINRWGFEAKIVSAIKAKCRDSANCTIRIADLTKFSWDKMFVFKYGAQRREVEEALGCPFPNYTEFTRKIVFMSEGKVVFSEQEPTNVERPLDQEVSFDVPDTDEHKQYGPDIAFSVATKTFDGGVFYILTQVR
jgi:hypothetical protein